ncbi:50S ribosomal protein L13 [candidate division WWE3 bacterium]|uniref:Large ribosomal subunit protein uL13 n=1 Tax=candidate division WWE3 bacterium TaxID=2053526 RepID=A0A7X9E6V2_UNCKA|nr:50S ribosomal protein L13 [candidate division WWE3 bacterium]
MKRTPNKTTVLSTADKKDNWHLIDAKGETLGKLATKIAVILVGKDKAEYVLNQNWGDKVVVINAEKIKVTGKKMTDKLYIHYTGFPHGLRTETLGNLIGRKPTEVIKKAVSGMLPKNKMRKQRMANLYIYAGDKHPHQAQLSK